MSIPAHTRKLLMIRSGGRCEIALEECLGKGIEPHHVKSKGRGGSDNITNLLWACRRCHDAVESHLPGTERFRTHRWQEEGQTEEDWISEQLDTTQ